SRGRGPGKNVGFDRRSRSASRDEAAVLTERDEVAHRSGRTDRGAALSPGSRPQVRSTHRLSLAAIRQDGGGEARAVPARGAAEHSPLRQVQQLRGALTE